MKLSIKGNSLRAKNIALRSCESSEARSPGRNDPFCATGECEAHLRVRADCVDGRAHYSVHTKQRYGSDPADQANTWCVSDQIGIVESIDIGSFGILDVLIEKDFACLDRSDEENEDTFPNPNAGTMC